MQISAFFYPILGYFLGSLPFGLWVTRIFKGTDIRKAGSGHVTTTNTIRQAGWLPGVMVAILDVSKGFHPHLLSNANRPSRLDDCIYGWTDGRGALLANLRRIPWGDGVGNNRREFIGGLTIGIFGCFRHIIDLCISDLTLCSWCSACCCARTVCVLDPRIAGH